MIAKLAAWLLRRKTFSEKDRIILTNAVIHSLDALPLRAIITVDEGRRILVQGKPLAAEQVLALQESAAAALANPAASLIDEQVRFAAIDRGFLQSDDPKTQLFYKAALWFAQERKNLLTQLSGPSDPTR